MSISSVRRLVIQLPRPISEIATAATEGLLRGTTASDTSFRLLRFYEMLANAEQVRDEMAAERRKLSGSPEWRTALQNGLRQLVENNPEVVAEAAEQLEWTLSSGP